MKAAELLARLRDALHLQQERGLSTALALATVWGIPTTANEHQSVAGATIRSRSRSSRSTVRSTYRRRRIRPAPIPQRRVRRYRAAAAPVLGGVALSS